jgi:hypothetical protein
VRLLCVCVVLCVGSGLETGWSSVQGVLPTVYRIKKLKSGQGPKGCRGIEKNKKCDSYLGENTRKCLVKQCTTKSSHTSICSILRYLNCIIITMTLQLCLAPWPLFSVSWSWLLWRGISPSQGRYLRREQHKHRINAHNTDIHALSRIRTHDPSVRASESSSCLRQHGHCDRLELHKGMFKT